MNNKPKYDFFKNTKYALNGLKIAFKKEKSFRIECVVCGFFAILSLFLKISFLWHFLFLGSLFLILCVECINSAIENICDLISKDFNPLIGAAKDLGSAAVFLSIIIAIICWIYGLLQLFLH